MIRYVRAAMCFVAVMVAFVLGRVSVPKQPTLSLDELVESTESSGSEKSPRAIYPYFPVAKYGNIDKILDRLYVDAVMTCPEGNNNLPRSYAGPPTFPILYKLPIHQVISLDFDDGRHPFRDLHIQVTKKQALVLVAARKADFEVTFVPTGVPPVQGAPQSIDEVWALVQHNFHAGPPRKVHPAPD